MAVAIAGGVVVLPAVVDRKQAMEGGSMVAQGGWWLARESGERGTICTRKPQRLDFCRSSTAALRRSAGIAALFVSGRTAQQEEVFQQSTEDQVGQLQSHAP